MTTCANCDAPDRDLYGPGRRPALLEVAVGNWISLSRCATCEALWCASPYEPYAAYEYIVRWTHGPSGWRQAHDLDDGRTLLRWHATAIRRGWLALPDEEREAVEAHRQRSAGHNPIDDSVGFGTLSEAGVGLLIGI